MATIHIPSTDTKKWTQPNMGDLMGILWATFNIDLARNEGKLTISPRTDMILNNTDDADLVYPSAFIRSSADSTDRWWALCDAVLFKSTSATTIAFAQDAIASTPTDLKHQYSDISEHEGSLIVSTSTDLHKLTAGTWTPSWWTGAGQLNQTALSSNIPHPLDEFERNILIGDGNFLHRIDRNNLVSYKRLTLPPRYQIRVIRHTSNRVYIGTKNLYGGRAAIFEWDGYSETYLKQHDVEGKIVFSMCTKDGVMHALTSKGYLYREGAYTFGKVDQLPVSISEWFHFDSSNTYSAEWYDQWSDVLNVHQRGMETIGGEIHVSLNACVNGAVNRIMDNFKSGIWCWKEGTGFYHRYSFNNYKSRTVYDIGTQVLVKAGGIAELDKDLKMFLAGASVYSDNISTIVHGIYCNSNRDNLTPKRGYFITTKIQTSNIEETWNKLWLKFEKFRDANNVIVVKYRQADGLDYNLPFTAGVTWVAGGQQFTSTSTQFANAAVGDEVEVMTGKGAGCTAHISLIAYVNPTYTITIDEDLKTTLGDMGGTAAVRVSDWIKEEAITSTTITKKDLSLVANATWIQFKIELRGYAVGSPDIDELVVSTEASITDQA